MKFAMLGAALVFASGLTYADHLTGKLMDSSCFDQNSKTNTAVKSHDAEKVAKTCAPTASTNDFTILMSKGRAYRLDREGNSKAAAAFRDGSLKPDKDGDMHVSLQGSFQGDSVKVDSVNGGK